MGQNRMLTGTIRTQIDQIWNAFWSGGVSNPLSVIEQLTFLLFIKRLGGYDPDALARLIRGLSA